MRCVVSVTSQAQQCSCGRFYNKLQQALVVATTCIQTVIGFIEEDVMFFVTSSLARLDKYSFNAPFTHTASKRGIESKRKVRSA